MKSLDEQEILEFVSHLSRIAEKSELCLDCDCFCNQKCGSNSGELLNFDVLDDLVPGDWYIQSLEIKYPNMDSIIIESNDLP